MHERDKDVFSVLVREHAEMLVTYIRTMIHDPAAVDGIFQETMIVAWRRFKDYDRSRPLAAWLRGIARRLVLAHYSGRSREPVYCNEAVLETLDERMARIDEREGDTWKERIVALEVCMNRPPDSLHRCIELFYRNEYKTKEIAAQLDTTREAGEGGSDTDSRFGCPASNLHPVTWTAPGCISGIASTSSSAAPRRD